MTLHVMSVKRFNPPLLIQNTDVQHKQFPNTDFSVNQMQHGFHLHGKHSADNAIKWNLTATETTGIIRIYVKQEQMIAIIFYA